MSLYNFLFGFDGIIIRDKEESSFGGCVQSYSFILFLIIFWEKKRTKISKGFVIYFKLIIKIIYIPYNYFSKYGPWSALFFFGVFC
jgi:hypothetical protein